MRAVLVALLALVLGPGAWAAWLGRLDPKQLLGPWYIVAVASGERGFAVEKATKNIEGVVVTLTPENRLKVLSSRHRLERCHLGVLELRRQNSAWVFQNPALGVLQYRVLGTNFRDFAVVFSQLEQRDEAFSTVELYSRTQRASPQAMSHFTRWSQGLGFLSQQQAQLQADGECGGRLCPVSGPSGSLAGLGCLQGVTPPVRPAGDGPGLRRLGEGAAAAPPAPLTAPLAPSSHLCAQGLPGKLPPQHRWAPRAPQVAGRAWGPRSPHTPVGSRAQGRGPEGGSDASPVNLGPPCLLGFQ
ncbi:epididymal-specific lipocalin-6 [Sturnira hondurensis]|uniref:epididymal-specific lipocalin-6 n=1 Tax=Sturnira hondurensis TaxID=192404 RepID=UPI001879522A|nr:epididymal-specific lipocalin-6 [Sturnira hondurensis]